MEKENKYYKPIYLGFASQKGGVGKSTLAEVLAAILYYEKGIDLIVVDCDGTQTSFKKLRDRDRALIEEDPQIAESIHAHFERFQRPSYRIIAAEPKDALRLVNSTLNGMGSSLPDMVIFDFPGHSSTKELLELSIQMDFIICPIEADVQSLTSSLAYAKTIRDIGVSTSSVRIQDIILVWNKVDRRARSLIIDEYTKYVKEIGLSLFDAQLYSSVKFSRELGQAGVKEVFRCSYLPPQPKLRIGTGLDEWVPELLQRIGLVTKSAE
ncbi:ParA family protein [Porphyromonas somerae]|uniref:ParA family protein n=1 Tax=Porphyromonas somerae TaxID=322095 RepID=UPI00263F1723|nr:ParA family protein [Porphyromonas somerae]MDN4753891.1 ParA family protein [Porphyromonadaceae bacterium W3.11]MDN4754988.1 ParA family protein [Porphyromonadaceae bacterium W3.11]MDY3884358.1 ParA family protein [Porphyromonas somerae]